MLTACLSASGHVIFRGQLDAGLALALAGTLYLTLTALAPALEHSDSPHCTAVTVVDLLLITAIVWLTGGVQSEYYLFYYVPLVDAGIRHNTRDGIAAALLAGTLYAFMAVADGAGERLVTSGPLRVVAVCLSAVIMVIFFTLLKREAGTSESLREALHSSLRRVAAVYDVAHAANKGANLGEVVSMLVDHAARATRAQSGAIGLLQRDGQLKAMAGYQADPDQAPPVVDSSSASAREAIATGSPVVVPREESSARASRAVISNTVYVPLATPGSPVGVLGLAFTAPRKLTRNHLEFLKSLCAEATMAIENAQLRSELNRLARTDPLTALPNRRELERRLSLELERAARYGRPLAVLMIDVDDLKLVNDRLGHPTGDQVLSALSQILTGNLRSSDSAGRMGGDEFLVVLPETTAAAAAAVGDRLIENFRTELEKVAGLADGLPLVGISIGVAAAPRGEAAPRALISLADGALYEAKRAGKNRTRVAARAEELTTGGAALT